MFIFPLFSRIKKIQSLIKANFNLIEKSSNLKSLKQR